MSLYTIAFTQIAIKSISKYKKSNPVQYKKLVSLLNELMELLPTAKKRKSSPPSIERAYYISLTIRYLHRYWRKLGLFFANDYFCLMDKKEEHILELIKGKAAEIAPQGVRMYLYGSRARGDARPDSDWDILILVNKPRVDDSDFDTLSYPLTVLGWEHGEAIIPVLYSIDEWNHPSSFLFRHNVERDSIVLV